MEVERAMGKSAVNVMSGICGMRTTIRASSEDMIGPVKLEMESECPHIQKLAAELTEVKAFEEIGFRGDGPKTLSLAARYCQHAACPVPSSIIKAIEVAAGLALPKDPEIHVEKVEN